MSIFVLSTYIFTEFVLKDFKEFQQISHENAGSKDTLMMLQNWFHPIVCFYAQAQKLNSMIIWLDVKKNILFSGLEDEDDNEEDDDDVELDKLVSSFIFYIKSSCVHNHIKLEICSFVMIFNSGFFSLRVLYYI